MDTIDVIITSTGFTVRGLTEEEEPAAVDMLLSANTSVGEVDFDYTEPTGAILVATCRKNGPESGAASAMRLYELIASDFRREVQFHVSGEAHRTVEAPERPRRQGRSPQNC